MSKSKRMLLFAVLAIVVIAAAIVIGYMIGQMGNTTVTPDVSQDYITVVDDGEDWKNTISFQGVNYTKNTNLKTILFLGVDDTEAGKINGDIGNRGRADSIILFLLDEQQETIQMLNISRDTMVQVKVYDLNGNYVGPVESQINMQYAYGESDLRSCWLMKQQVANLLYGIDIDYYLALTMEGISATVDAIGGVTVTMPEDYTDVDPAYTAGTTVKLDGAAAEQFVRYRDTDVSGSNDTRMERQSCFFHALFSQSYASGDTSALLSVFQSAADTYMTTDLDADTMKLFSGCVLSDETYKVPGKTQEGASHDEYYVDEEALQALLIELFYIPEGEESAPDLSGNMAR